MHTHAIRTLMLFLAASSAAWAAPVIDVGTHYLLPNDVRTISIAVSGGDQVDALNFYVQVADGGASNGGSATTPKITGIKHHWSGYAVLPKQRRFSACVLDRQRRIDLG